MKYVSLFAGIGGFDLALNRLGHECVWANEWDKYAAEIFKKNFTGNKKTESDKWDTNESREGRGTLFQTNGIDTRDIRTVPTSEIPDHDLLVGGFPCQAFSIAGKRGGFEDTRGTLFFEIARIARVKRPKLLLLENVKGLLSHDNGRTFGTILATLSGLGYFSEWQVLNSKDFGVPQNRERVFIVGHLGRPSRGTVFPIGCGNPEIDAERGIEQLNMPTHSNDRVYGKNGLSPCLNTMGGGRRQPKILSEK